MMKTCTLADGAHIQYALYPGSEDRPWLIFLHEGLGSIAQWQDFPQRLCQRTDCPGLAYDRLGHGGSSPLDRPRTIHYLHEYALIELPQLIQTLLPDQRYILIGHSDGGSISLIFAAGKPSNLLGIITEAAHVRVEPITIQGVEEIAQTHAQGRLRGLSRYHGDKADSLFGSWAEAWQSPWFASWSIEYLLPAIDVPLMVLQGRDDQYGSEAQVDAIVAHSAGQATPIILEDCGHAPHQDFPELVLDIVSCFVNRISR